MKILKNIKINFTFAGVLSLVLAFSSELASAEPFRLGIDVMKYHFSAKKDYGRNVFISDPWAFNFYGAYFFNDDIFSELGYEFQRKDHRATRLVLGENRPGAQVIVDPTISLEIHSFVQQKHPYLMLGYQWMNSQSDMALTLALGVSASTIKAEHTVVGDTGIFNRAYTEDEIAVHRRTYRKRKLVPTLKVAYVQKLDFGLGFRVTGTWRKTSSFKMKAKETNAGEIRFKDSYGFGLGFFYNF